MWSDPALSVADLHQRLLERGFTEVGCSKNKVTLQAPGGGRMELPRQMTGRVFGSHVERAARLLHLSTDHLLDDPTAEADSPDSAPSPVAKTDGKRVLTAGEGARLVYQGTARCDTRRGSTTSDDGNEEARPRLAEPEHPPAITRDSAGSAGRGRTGRTTHVSAVLTVMAETGHALNFDAIVAGCRRAGHQVDRDQVQEACAALARDGHLVRVRRGVYRAGDVTGSSGRVDIRVHGPDASIAPRPEPALVALPASVAGPGRSEGVQTGLPADSQEAWDRLFGRGTAVSGSTVPTAAEWLAVTERLLQGMQQRACS